MDFTSKTGALIKITSPSFYDLDKLTRSIMKALGKTNLSLLGGNGFLEMEVEALLAPVLSVISDDDVNAHLWPCLARCTWNGSAVTPEFLDNEKARKDYYEIIGLLIKEQVLPFMGGLPSMLFALMPKNESESPK